MMAQPAINLTRVVNCASVDKSFGVAAPLHIFPPRRERRRQSLAAIHRQVVNRLREAALLEFIRLHQFLI